MKSLETSKVAVYLRVSTAEQNLDGQREAVERWLSGNGITDAVFFEEKISGTKMDRPIFKQLQQAIFNGEIKTVVCYKLDRLSRNQRDGINLLHDWLEKGVRIVSVTQQMDFSGAVGKFVANILLGLSEMENSTRRDRQADGIQAAKRRGAYKGRVAGSKVYDPSRIQELKDKGLTHKEIATALGCNPKTIQRALRTA